MKNFVFCAIMAIAALVSCAKMNDLSEGALFAGSNEIAFSTKATNAATRAIVEGTTMVDNFGAYGYVVPGSYSTEGGYIMRNAEFLPDGTAANGAHYYWPKSDNNENIEILFTAYAQYDSTIVYDAATGNITVTVPELTAELIADPSGFDDVLWAQTEANHQNALLEKEKVPLHFKHALAWLQFHAEVAQNASIEYVKIKSIEFGEYTEGQEYQPAVPGTPYQPAVPAQYDTTDTWFNLRRSSNVDGSPTRTSTDGGATYVDNLEIPAALVAEIKSYYSINNGTAADYDLHMGNSAWPSAEIRQLRIVKDVPAAYRLPVEASDGSTIVFFNALKYLEDNGYKVTYRISGGKPDIFNYPIIDLFVNGTAFTIVGLNFSTATVYDASVASNIPALQRTVELVQEAQPEVPEVPGSPEVPAIPAGIALDSLYVGGTITLPTRTLAETFALENGTKVPSLNFVAGEVTLNGSDYAAPHDSTLANILVVPQNVPEHISFIYDICVYNKETGDHVVFSDRRITRTINTGKDSDNCDYPTKWLSSNKYIYNFKVTAEGIDFDVDVNSWDANTPVTNSHVWDYAN